MATNESAQNHTWRWLEKYVSFIYRNAILVMFLSFSIVAIVSYWLFGVYGFHVSANIPNYRWYGEPIINAWDAYANTQDVTYFSTKQRNSLTNTIPELSEQLAQGVIVYERRGQNLLDIEVLRDIWRLENKLYSIPDFEKYCYKPNQTKIGDIPIKIDPKTKCMLFQSFIEYLKDAVKLTSFIPNPQPENLTQRAIDYILKQPAITANFLGRGCNSTNKYSQVLRSMLSFGTPQNGFINAADKYDSQFKQYTDWAKGFVKPIEELTEHSPNGLKGFDYLPGLIDQKISDLVEKQILWLIGSFGFLIIYSIFHMKTLFVSLFGVIGIFFSIPCAIATIHGPFSIKHFDALNVIGLFLICGIGSDCMFILFDLVKQSSHTEAGKQSVEKRLAWAVHHGLIALATSLSTAAVAFLALVGADFRIMQYFGIFCFLELFYDFVFTFSWYLAVICIWIKYFEKKPEDQNNEPLVSSKPELDSITSKEIIETVKDYPNNGLFDFMSNKATFKINASGLAIHEYNGWEKFFHNYLGPFIYFYRFPIVLFFIVLTFIMAYFTAQIKTKFEIQYLNNEHNIQRGLTLLENAFETSYIDFSLVYVWGISDTITHKFSDFLYPDKFGSSIFTGINLSLPSSQQYLSDVCDFIENSSLLIDHTLKTGLVCPIRILKEYSINQTGTFPVPHQNYSSVMKGFQDLLGNRLGITDNSVLWKGTSSKNTIGFSYDNQSLMYIAMKATMKQPKDRSSDSLHVLYELSKNLSRGIDALKPQNFSINGYMTAFPWVQMKTQDAVGKQALVDVVESILFAALVIFISTLSFRYTFLVAISMGAVVVIIIGILYLDGWMIGVNEAVMISIAAGYSADFIIQPMLAMAHDNSGLSVFGKLQKSITMFASPVSSALCTTLAAAAFLFPSVILLFPPFATFLVMSGLFGFIFGFIVLPAMISMTGVGKRKEIEYDEIK